MISPLVRVRRSDMSDLEIMQAIQIASLDWGEAAARDAKSSRGLAPAASIFAKITTMIDRENPIGEPEIEYTPEEKADVESINRFFPGVVVDL